MIDTQVQSASRHLPAAAVGDVERMGYKMLAALDRLGFVHTAQDGHVFSVRFAAVRQYGQAWAAFHVDSERLYHFSVSDLAKPDVIRQLGAVVHKPVRAWADDGGLAYVVELAKRAAVRLPDRAVLDLDARPAGLDLAVPVGMGHEGAEWRELAALGHALIAGTSGSGKSTFLHAALAGLLSGAGPDRLQVALIDPKRSELVPWANVPHLWPEHDIAYTTSDAGDLLADLADEINRRGDALGRAACRDIAAYNKQTDNPMPYILVIADEVLDLAGERGIAESLKTIARRGRSAGVILWAATQHAAALDGLPRIVNVNLATRFVFRVVDRSAAETAGCPGAERIPRDRPGRMLAKMGGPAHEVQGFYLADDKLQALTRSLARGGAGASNSKFVLTAGQAALVRFAVQELGGAFIKNKLAARFAGQWTDYAIKVLAQDWERQGLLTTPANRADPRRVTPKLAELAGLGDEPADA